MALTKKPVTGMKDIQPAEMQIREYVMNQIRETYKSFGFSQIETPCVEHIANLTSKQGGDNEKLIFKILKRGEKLNLDAVNEENDLVDSGLRYDLTLPLSRYYANNAANLPKPFKALQMGSVWRADRPQKGRFRQFVQCDIDILGDATSLAEIELILATTTALGRICPDNAFTVRINDRGILKGMALHCGFPEESMDQVFIILDKMDKIGFEGVERELLESGYAETSVSQYMELLRGVGKDADGVRRLGGQLADVLPAQVSENLAHIMDTVNEVAEADFGLEFDPTLAILHSHSGCTYSQPSPTVRTAPTLGWRISAIKSLTAYSLSVYPLPAPAGSCFRFSAARSVSRGAMSLFGSCRRSSRPPP